MQFPDTKGQCKFGHEQISAERFLNEAGAFSYGKRVSVRGRFLYHSCDVQGAQQREEGGSKGALAAIENVDSVSYDRDSSDYNSGEYTLYILNTKYGYDTEEETVIEKQVTEKFSGYEVTVKNDDASAPDIPLSVYLAAFGIILVVLLISCGSYFEPILFLLTIGIAVVLNLGTNFFLGEISAVSFGIAAVTSHKKHKEVVKMRKHFRHCLLCGRVIPEESVYCELCRSDAESSPLDPDRIYDPETDPLPHHEFPETDQQPPYKRRIGKGTTKGNG